jgi:CRP/FNR family cyclic AMP-dependent transcriptional regulator
MRVPRTPPAVSAAEAPTAPQAPATAPKAPKAATVPKVPTPPKAHQVHLHGGAITSVGPDHWPRNSFINILPEAERAALLRTGTSVRFADDEILVLQGDVGDFLYVLTEGKVKVLVSAESGVETMLAIRARGDLVGEFALLDAKPRTATARAIGAVGARRVSRADYTELAAGYPAVTSLIFKYVLGKVRASTVRLAAERTWGAKGLLAQELYGLATEYGEPGPGGVVRVPITQAELGQLAGVAVSTTERVLKEFRDRGIIATRYGATDVLDMAGLAAIRFPEEDRSNPLLGGMSEPNPR